MAAMYKPSLRAEHEESRVRLVFGRRGLRHELHDVSRLQGNFHPAEQLLGINASRDAVMHEDELARVFGSEILGGDHGLSQRQILRPGDNVCLLYTSPS